VVPVPVRDGCTWFRPEQASPGATLSLEQADDLAVDQVDLLG
jgi:hypothetical protein